MACPTHNPITETKLNRTTVVALFKVPERLRNNSSWAAGVEARIRRRIHLVREMEKIRSDEYLTNHVWM